jgi:phosphatidylserine decarboxylase
MIRFWRTPRRKINPDDKLIASPADGNIIYIKKLEKDETPISVKGNKIQKLEELTKTDLLKKPCWLIGINMTPFDVHKNCSPINGKITLQKHTNGKFLSLKAFESETENERNTFIVENKNIQVGIVQIASRLVKRIDVYKTKNTEVTKGEWLGMIRFGSQVDVILPINAEIMVNFKDQVYAGKTVLAKYEYPH